MDKKDLKEAIKRQLVKQLQENTEILDSQPTPEFDYEDAVGNFWLVKRAMNESTDDELICETDIFGLAEMISKGLTKENIAGIYRSENKARTSSKRSLRKRDQELKEAVKTGNQQKRELKQKIEEIKAEIASKTQQGTDEPGSRDAVASDLSKLYKKLTRLEDLSTRLEASLKAEKGKKKDKEEETDE